MRLGGNLSYELLAYNIVISKSTWACLNHFLGPPHLSIIWTGRSSFHRLSLSSKSFWAIDLISTRKLDSIYAADYQSLNESKIKENCVIDRVWIIDICAVCLKIFSLLSPLSRTTIYALKVVFVRYPSLLFKQRLQFGSRKRMKRQLDRDQTLKWDERPNILQVLCVQLRDHFWDHFLFMIFKFSLVVSHLIIWVVPRTLRKEIINFKSFSKW